MLPKMIALEVTGMHLGELHLLISFEEAEAETYQIHLSIAIVMLVQCFVLVPNCRVQCSCFVSANDVFV